jgi:acyl-CoA synthetase (AMP-forming)/AMP-acid ligase II
VVNALRTTLAGYKVPRQIRFVDQIPRLPNGKIDYASALAMAQSGAADSAAASTI